MSITASLPPLVEPGPALTAEQMQRYSRHLLIPGVGDVGQRRLAAARVLVLGAGGLGAPTLMYLAAAGVGTLGVVDCDTVEMSNLQRQVIHGESDIGRPKVVSAAEQIARVNPQVTVVQHDVRLTSDNALELFADYDLILDGTDNFATRYLVNDACVLAGKPYVWGSIFRFEGQVSVFWAEHGPQYRDLYPTPPPPGSVPSCAEGGVLGVLCATIGSIMGTEAVKLLCGVGRSLLGRILVYDALEMTFRTIAVTPDPAAPAVTGLIDYDEFCGSGRPAESDGPDRAITPAELAELLDSDEPPLLVDVREVAEHELVSIGRDVLIPSGRILSGAANGELPRDRPILLYCRSGGRSAACVQALLAQGFRDVRHLDGGILAWADEIAPSLPRY